MKCSLRGKNQIPNMRLGRNSVSGVRRLVGETVRATVIRFEGIAKPICKKTAAPPPNSGKNHYLKRLNHASRSAPWNYFTGDYQGSPRTRIRFYFWRKQFLRWSLRAQGGRYSKQHEEFMDLTYGHRMASFRGRMEIEAGKQKVEAHLPVDPFFLPLSRVKGAIDIYN